MEIKRLSKILKALSNEHRLLLYSQIAQQQEANFQEASCLVSEIMKMFKLTAPTLSHHLKELSNAKLIITEKRGKHLLAKVDPDTFRELENMIMELKDAM